MTPEEEKALVEKAGPFFDAEKNYQEGQKALDDVLHECIRLSQSKAGIASPTGRHFYASVLFTMLLNRGVSLAILVPHSSWAQKVIENWDYATAFGIVRTMLEARIAYFYLCTEVCKDDEWDCRWNLFNLHDCVARRRMFEAMDDGEEVAKFEAEAENLRERLKANSHFSSLTDGQKRKLLNGQTAYLFPLEELAERAGISRRDFRWLYVFFSTHVHNLPMSFYRMGGESEDRGRGVHSEVEEGYTILAISFALALLTETRDEYRRMFDGLEREGATATA